MNSSPTGGSISLTIETYTTGSMTRHKSPTARARTEIAVAFAHRWAEIRRLPPALRAAASAALEAEQAATLSARISYLVEQLRAQNRTHRAQLRSLYADQRKAITTRHGEAGASAVSHAQRPGLKAPKSALAIYNRMDYSS